MDEATPHLHLDYIPVATGYTRGMKKRNSLTKAFQNMGFFKGRGKKDNETIDWQKREREYLTELCKEHGIEIEVLGVERPSLSLPEYRKVIHEAEELKIQNAVLSQENNELTTSNEELKEKNEMLMDEIQAAILEAQTSLDDMEEEQEVRKKKLDQTSLEMKRQELETQTKKTVDKEVVTLVGNAKSQVIETTKGLFDSEPYVKVPRKLWEKMLKAYEWGLQKSKMVDKLTEQNVFLKEKAKGFRVYEKKVAEFLGMHNMTEVFREFLHPKKESIKSMLVRNITKSQEKSAVESSTIIRHSKDSQCL